MIGKDYCNPVTPMNKQRMNSSKPGHYSPDYSIQSIPCVHSTGQLPCAEIDPTTGYAENQKKVGDRVLSRKYRTPLKVICRAAHPFAINRHGASAEWLQKYQAFPAGFLEYPLNAWMTIVEMRV